MKQNANEGLPKVYWLLGITLITVLILGAIFWWLDAYLLNR